MLLTSQDMQSILYVLVQQDFWGPYTLLDVLERLLSLFLLPAAAEKQTRDFFIQGVNTRTTFGLWRVR